MKLFIQTSLTTLLFSILSLTTVAASASAQDSGAEFAKWVGTIQCRDYNKTSNHDHDAVFIRKEDNKKFDIVESEDFVKTQCSSSKSALLELEAKKTSRFLFWGGNLIVKNAAVIEEIGEAVHKAPMRKLSRDFQGARGGR